MGTPSSPTSESVKTAHFPTIAAERIFLIQAKLLPHASLLLLFTTSALSHIFPEIRIDAVKFLDLLLDLVPDLVAGGWIGAGSAEDLGGGRMGFGDPSSSSSAGVSGGGQRVLDGYLSLLNLKGKQGGEFFKSIPFFS